MPLLYHEGCTAASCSSESCSRIGCWRAPPEPAACLASPCSSRSLSMTGDCRASAAADPLSLLSCRRLLTAAQGETDASNRSSSLAALPPELVSLPCTAPAAVSPSCLRHVGRLLRLPSAGANMPLAGCFSADLHRCGSHDGASRMQFGEDVPQQVIISVRQHMPQQGCLEAVRTLDFRLPRPSDSRLLPVPLIPSLAF